MLLALLALVGCGPDLGSIAKDFTIAVGEAREGDAMALRCADDRATFEKPEINNSELASVLKGKFTAEIVSIEETPPYTKVTVSAKGPDYRKYRSDLWKLPAEKRPTDFDSAVLEAARSGSIPSVSGSGPVWIREGDEGACVFEDLVTQDKVSTALRGAWDDSVPAGEAKAAIESARTALSTPVAVDLLTKVLDEALAKVEYRIKAEAEKDAYKPLVLISGVEIKSMCRSCSRHVLGEVKNTGDRALDQVQVIVYGLDADGKPVFEKEDTPVWVGLNSPLTSHLGFSEFMPGASETPLKPNYSHRFAVMLDDPPPSAWAGKVDVKVKDIEFEGWSKRFDK